MATIVEHPAPEPLKEYVRCIRVIEVEPSTPETSSARMLPCGCSELVIHAGDAQPRCMLHGQLSRAWRDPGSPAGVTPVRGPGQAHPHRPEAVTFRFLPDGASALFGLRMDSLTDRQCSVAELFGRTGRQLEEGAACWATMEERIGAGTAFLLARERKCAPDPLVRELVQQIEACRGQVAVAALKRSFTISARQLERRFTVAVGLSPKLFARILRLRWFADHAERCTDRSLAEMAREAGYFDQAHLNHDFKALTGLSPRQFFRVVA